MTRANTEQQKHTPWFANAGAACSIVPVSRFVGPHAFATKGGDYGAIFSAEGIDTESLTDEEIEVHLATLEGALRGLPEGFIPTIVSFDANTREGKIAAVTGDAEALSGRKPTAFEDFVAASKAAFLG